MAHSKVGTMLWLTVVLAGAAASTTTEVMPADAAVPHGGERKPGRDDRRLRDSQHSYSDSKEQASMHSASYRLASHEPKCVHHSPINQLIHLGERAHTLRHQPCAGDEGAHPLSRQRLAGAT